MMNPEVIQSILEKTLGTMIVIFIVMWVILIFFKYKKGRKG